MVLAKLETAAVRLRIAYQTVGLKGLWRALAYRLSIKGHRQRRRINADNRRFDALGYDTSQAEQLEKLDTAGRPIAHSHHYAATPSYIFDVAVGQLDVNPDDCIFIDFGSGKGRAVLMAADLPFRQIIGVEFARELHETAEANLRIRAAKFGVDSRILLVHEDATRFAIPAGPLIVFVFNSFAPPILTEVARNLFSSWQQDPRPMRIVYVNPAFPAEWTDAGFRPVKTASDRSYVIYRDPAGMA